MAVVTEFIEALAATQECKNNKRLARRKAARAKFNSRLRFINAVGLIVSAFTSRELGHLKNHGWVKRVSRPKEFKWSVDDYGKRQPESLQAILRQESKMMDTRGLIEKVIENPGCSSWEDRVSVTIGDTIFSNMFEK